MNCKSVQKHFHFLLLLYTGSILHTKTTYNILGELQELAKGLVPRPIPEPPSPFPFSGDTYESHTATALRPPNPGEALKACPLGNKMITLSVCPSVCLSVCLSVRLSGRLFYRVLCDLYLFMK